MVAVVDAGKNVWSGLKLSNTNGVVLVLTGAKPACAADGFAPNENGDSPNANALVDAVVAGADANAPPSKMNGVVLVDGPNAVAVAGASKEKVSPNLNSVGAADADVREGCTHALFNRATRKWKD